MVEVSRRGCLGSESRFQIRTGSFAVPDTPQIRKSDQARVVVSDANVLCLLCEYLSSLESNPAGGATRGEGKAVRKMDISIIRKETRLLN